ncbi:MAG: hypothetical protein BGO12_13395 [Verrucomicrobia bacterium 61-8]|nr:site-specific integrase [Verrucomicrobiota bacterium]OJV22373.1 MAG: hypothetical protein BGO12_13395 [Verrucomicrobia bacterium 61-8]
MPKTAVSDPAAKGIYKQKLGYWLRYSLDGVQHRVNLQTRDFQEAVAKAAQLRGMPVAGKTERMAWKRAIASYIDDKIKGVKPHHLAGRRSGSFSPSTADRTRGILEVFAARSGAKSPQEVTQKHLQRYYDERRKTSEASAQSIINRVQAFLGHLNCRPGHVQFPSGAKKERRTVTISIEESNRWISDAPNDKLRFILYCGFHCGLRRGEIVHARPAWFDLKRRVLTVPAREDQKLSNGQVFKWRAKDGETREIPLSEEFTAFLRSNLDPDALFVLEPDKSGGKARYRYDPRRIFENYVSKMGRADAFYHAMRHSFISNLCNSGNHSITEVAAWSGDTIEVLEKNYWHKTTRTGGLDATMKGRHQADEQASLVQKIAQRLDHLIEEGIIDKSTAKELWKGFESEEEERGMNERWAAEEEYLE